MATLSTTTTPTTASAPVRAARRAWLRLARGAYWPVVLGLAALNGWWWWDARPLPNLKAVQGWIGVEREVGSRPVAWWDITDVPRDNRGAIAVLRRAVRQSPNDPEARFLLGRALGAAKDYLACAEQLRQVPSWSPRKPEAQYIEGMAWLQLS